MNARSRDTNRKLVREIERCRRTLLEAYATYADLSHPAVLEASRIMDRAIAAYLRSTCTTEDMPQSSAPKVSFG
ncbi:MAG: Spo0E family sporulation regulatory protein-aspartic acid phosphatase [Firmicutes bacterium]|jgi:hypothetical protein|nr:Spo0E family sporulation regulatory protein-aspartic acid phosphatase [Bacillota bacterium]